MNRLLDRKFPAMHGISFQNTRILLDLLEKAKHTDQALIQKRYSNYASNFDATLEFLENLQILRLRDGIIIGGKHLKDAKKKLSQGLRHYNKFLVVLLLGSETRYGKEIRELLLGFRDDEGPVKLTPLMNNNDSSGRLFAARNTLLEADLLHIDHTTGVCEIPTDMHDLYIQAKYCCGISPKLLHEQCKQNQEIGLQAEESVVEYERSIVGKRFAELVVHVALYNASAGFDIHSVRTESGTVSENRLIEVKAVNPRNHSFYLTSNEYNMAKTYRNKYFLYLVPVREEKPRVQEMVILKDPLQSVFEKPSEWEVIQNNILCRRIGSH